MLRTVASGLLAAGVVAGTLLAPAPAKAWVREGWRGPVVYGPPVVVAPPVVIVRPVHPVRVARHWFPAHYTRFGIFVPGHWG